MLVTIFTKSLIICKRCIDVNMYATYRKYEEDNAPLHYHYSADQNVKQMHF